MVRVKLLLVPAIAALLCLSTDVLAKPVHRPGVAVVIDPVTYEKAHDAVDEYVSSMSLDGKKGILLVDRWGVPDSIRAALIDLRSRESIEGAVLVGDIPIPMIRDAQHLCSAFKMDQNRDWRDSSVPSDRFYDDFSLEFRFLRQDEEHGELFYYSLLPSSPQHVSSDIYSARIRPEECPEKYDMIAAYLRKAAAAKRQSAGIDRVLLFAGHGYNSESMNARMDEYRALHSQFPSLGKEGGRLDFINYDFDDSVKARLLSALSDSNLDVAILHHHGYVDMQLLNGSPYASTPDGWLSLARNYFRVKMRASRNQEKTRKDYMDRYGIPEQWLDDAFDPGYILQDSLYARSLDIYTDDIDNYGIGARFVMFDACFNGAFIEPDYVAAHYLFGRENATLVALAHSVNTLQDVWSDELVGLLDRGVCAGNIYRNTWNLETHLFGDPTFHFGPVSELDGYVSGREKDVRLWKRLLDSDEHCDVKSLAIRMLLQQGALSGEQLLDIQRGSGSGIVRLAAFNGNTVLAGDCLVEAISAGLDDSYEMLQRISARYAGYNQSPELSGKIVSLYMSPVTSARVLFQVKTALMAMDSEVATSLISGSDYWKGDDAKTMLLKSVAGGGASAAADIANLLSAEPDMKSARSFIRSQRNLCRVDALAPMGKLYSSISDESLKQMIAEVFGWYRYSYARDEAVDICRDLLRDESVPELRDELAKSITRLSE